MTSTDRPLEDDYVVIRGGSKRTFEPIAHEIQDAMDQSYGPVLSVSVDAAVVSESADTTLYRIAKQGGIPHGKIQVTTVGALRKAGFSIESYVPEGWAENHCHVLFSDPVSESQVMAFVDCFSEPMPNPTAGKK